MLKYSKKYIYYHIFIGLFTSAFIALLFSVNEGEGWNERSTTIFCALTAAIFLLNAIYVYLFWRCASYEFTEEAIVWRRGVIFKQKIVLPYSKIHAIDYRQNIIQRIFKIKILQVDSGATTKASMAEVAIVSDNEKIIDLEKLIRNKMNGDVESIQDETSQNNKEENKDLVYKFTGKLKAIFAIFNGLISILVLLIGAIIIGSVLIFFPQEDFNIVIFIVAIIFCLIVAWICLFIFSFLYAGLKFFKYEIIKKEKHLIISYGIISKVHHTINYDKIKAIRVEEGFFKRMFKMATIKIEVVGYGEVSNQNSQTTNNLYIPLCKKSEIGKYLSALPAEFQMEGEREKAPKRSVRFFFGLKIIISSIIFIAFLPLVIGIANNAADFHAASKLYLIGIILVYAVIILDGFLAWRNAGITILDNKVIVHRGSFNKIHIIIPNKNIISVEKITTYFRKSNGLESYVIHFYNDARKNTERASLLDKELYEKLSKVLSF